MSTSLFLQIKQAIDNGAAPGCAVGIYDNGQLQTFACGSFSGSGSQVVSPQTLFDLASISKLFTTALALRAHEQGMVSIYDRCGLYLENFQDSELRLIDLLTHRAEFQGGLGQLRAAHPTKAKLYAAIMHMLPPRQAANHVEYHNAGPLFVGYILEKAAGKPLRQQMTELFKDLRLHNTYTGVDVLRQHLVTPPTEIVDGQAISGMTHDETARMLGGLVGHAGVFSTAEDLVMFGRAWLDRTIITTDTLRNEVFHDHDPSGKEPQAVGWWMRYNSPSGSVPTPTVFSHTGYTGSLLAVNPTNGKVCTVVCNRTYYGRDNTKHRVIWQLLMNWISR